jgi:hypothetical protein
MRFATPDDLKTIFEQAAKIRDQLTAMDVGKVSTRAIGGAVILTASFLVIANPHAPTTPDSSAVVAARIAPIGTVQLAPSAPHEMPR